MPDPCKRCDRGQCEPLPLIWWRCWPLIRASGVTVASVSRRLIRASAIVSHFLDLVALPVVGVLALLPLWREPLPWTVGAA